MTDEQQIAALREEIRRRCRSYRWVWGLVCVWVAIDALLLPGLWIGCQYLAWPLWFGVASVVCVNAG
jgi:hypothetical protein